MTQAHGAHIGVGLRSKLGGAATEGLGLRQQLDVCLHANHHLKLRLKAGRKGPCSSVVLKLIEQPEKLVGGQSNQVARSHLLHWQRVHPPQLQRSTRLSALEHLAADPLGFSWSAWREEVLPQTKRLAEGTLHIAGSTCWAGVLLLCCAGVLKASRTG